MRDSREIQVLVVDDDLALCELLRTTFELEGIKILEAHHVIEAERLLMRRRIAYSSAISSSSVCTRSSSVGTSPIIRV